MVAPRTAVTDRRYRCFGVLTHGRCASRTLPRTERVRVILCGKGIQIHGPACGTGYCRVTGPGDLFARKLQRHVASSHTSLTRAYLDLSRWKSSLHRRKSRYIAINRRNGLVNVFKQAEPAPTMRIKKTIGGDVGTASTQVVDISSKMAKTRVARAWFLAGYDENRVFLTHFSPVRGVDFPAVTQKAGEFFSREGRKGCEGITPRNRRT